MVQHNGPDRAAVPRDTLNPTDIPATQPSPPTHFRPFRRQQECSVVAQAMKYLENSGFYYGPLEVDEAHARLAHLPLGTFLIRDSTQTDVFFTLSYQAPEGPTSVRVLLGDEGFALDGSKHAFPCLFALLEFYIASPKRSLRNPYRGTSSQTLQEIARRAVVRVYGRDGLEALPVSATVRSYLQLHPLATFLHLFFRIGAVIAYLCSDWFSRSFATCFVLVLTLLSCDFWSVKNVSGRLLVGLRWWNQIDEDGQSHWVFEAKKNHDNSGTEAEMQIFWLGLIICPLIWTAFFFTTLFSLKMKWLVLVVVGISLQATNLYGYLRCKAGEQETMPKVASQYLGQQFIIQRE